MLCIPIRMRLTLQILYWLHLFCRGQCLCNPIDADYGIAIWFFFLYKLPWQHKPGKSIVRLTAPLSGRKYSHIINRLSFPLEQTIVNTPSRLVIIFQFKKSHKIWIQNCMRLNKLCFYQPVLTFLDLDKASLSLKLAAVQVFSVVFAAMSSLYFFCSMAEQRRSFEI